MIKTVSELHAELQKLVDANMGDTPILVSMDGEGNGIMEIYEISIEEPEHLELLADVNDPEVFVIWPYG